jgi:carboxyl-terminal processing protease
MGDRQVLCLGTLAGAAFAATVMAVANIPGHASASASDTYRQLNLFGAVYEAVINDYVDKPDETKLVRSAINGMLSGLDPHSSYMDPKGYQDMQVQTRGEFGGLGVEVTTEDGVMKVVSPIDDSPAAKAGILSGDVILEVDGTSTDGLTLEQLVEKMRGRADSEVRLKISRKGQSEPLVFNLTRSVIHIKSVKSRLEGDIAYIRLSQFSEQTFENLSSSIAQLRKQVPAGTPRGVVLDLRNNPGGLLDQAIAVTNAFLPRGEIVSTRGRNPDDMQRFAAKDPALLGTIPMVVLINGGSASASEIVSGALQDHHRATIIGTRSFGKGSVQTIVPLGQDGAMRLTTARYYTPSGRSIQAKGIEPDIAVTPDVPADLQGRDEMPGEASLRGHLKNGDEEKSGSSSYVPTDPKSDRQLIFALDYLRKGLPAAAPASPDAKAD